MARADDVRVAHDAQEHDRAVSDVSWATEDTVPTSYQNKSTLTSTTLLMHWDRTFHAILLVCISLFRYLECRDRAVSQLRRISRGYRLSLT